ncbi:hypothetical protein [Desulfurivibrio alkaliphilus]|uniref:Lipoprotein n=1 Tax=Desulfurivibrio alkaliphilus (strain DSM 19089 / UNIQEM U267 / AHT2) TaxID=589865 RepID=D6Z4B4_DESAT|nr:hypothetical protein [Desulfurivibrio alkaliphilus]ADH86389.1 hypothetical protein DaAHT2_1697 [Desulfurivibrio alkaliphilus AHT 2]
MKKSKFESIAWEEQGGGIGRGLSGQPLRLLGCALLLVLLLASCGAKQQQPGSIYVPPVKGAPVVYLHPAEPGHYRQATVGVLPFRVPANHEAAQGEALAALFRDVLLAKEVFPRVVTSRRPYGDFEDAIAQGRQAGVDLVLAGRLHRALDATELGGARAEMSIRLINVHSGNTVWHIAQAMDQPVDHHDVGTWNRIRESFSLPPIRPSRGAPPLPNMLAVMAEDMSEVLKGARQVPK